MKNRVLFLLLMFASAIADAQIRWDGESGDGLWYSALNWVGDIIPGTTDQVLLDNSIVAGSYTVTLPAGDIATAVGYLIITPASTFNISLVNPASNISTNGFTATGAGDAIILNNGAIFLNASGASSGTPVSVTSTNFFRINNGGKYVHHTARGHTDFLASRLSTATGTEQGVFEFDVPGTASYTVSGSNRTYGQLVFSATAAGGTKTYTSSGIGPLQVNGDLIINTNVVFSYGVNTNKIIVNGNCIVSAGALFNISNSSNNASIILKGNLNNAGLITETGSSVGSELELNGSLQQTINCPGVISQSVSLKINNPGGVVLSSPLVLPYRLHLLNGKIFSSMLHPLVLMDNAICTGGSALSFVEGPVKKIGDDDFVFPVGKGGIYAPITISGTGGSINDEFTAEYMRLNPQSTSGLGNVVEAPIHHVSFVEYWRLSRDVGNSSKWIRMTVNPESFAMMLNSLRVARFDTGIWQNEGGTDFIASVPAPPYVTGSFTSDAAVDNFGYFTIGTTDAAILNPLPVQLISFDAIENNRGFNSVSWQLASGDHRQTSFEIHRSADGNSFHTIDMVPGNRIDDRYYYEDRNPLPGNNYYQLKITDSAGLISHSRVVLVLRNKMKAELISASSLHTKDRLIVTLSAPKSQLWQWIIVDMQGEVVRRKFEKISSGSSRIILPVQGLRPGIYFVFACTDNARTNVLRWIKE